MESIEGKIEVIKFRNEETGYTVIRLRLLPQGDLVTVVGNMPPIEKGEEFRFYGDWVLHEKYGRQFHLASCEKILPRNPEAIEKFLSSGLIKGIGENLARSIVSTFGESTLKVLDEDQERLMEVPKIGEKRLEIIRGSWEKAKDIRDLLITLNSLGLSHNLALKIIKHYGRDCLKVLKENPYRLAEDIYGVGFVKADRISRLLGIEESSRTRIEAGVLYILDKAQEDGHVFLPLSELLDQSSRLLGIDSSVIESALPYISDSGKIVIDDTPSGKAAYLRGLHVAEKELARRLRAINSFKGLPFTLDFENLLKDTESNLKMSFSHAQKEAVITALKNKVTLITGGPGTGKTTVIRGIIDVSRRLNLKVLLCAPTGRAAKRMEEATGHPAHTIHRLLEYSPNLKRFRKNEDNPLEVDLLIVDESSMIDTVLMSNLLKATPKSSMLVLVGDSDQLPSVGPGNVFRDLIESSQFPCVRLNQIFRQAMGSLIVLNAHRIMSGAMPILAGREKGKDFIFYERSEPEEILNTIVALIRKQIPEEYGISKEEIQILSPMHKGKIGVSSLNEVLQKVMNPTGPEIRRGLRLGDRVIQLKNNYDKEVFNGDIGRIEAVAKETGEIEVSYDSRLIRYDPTELDEIMPAYAISIHKSQGSEYKCVIVPVTTSHYVMLQRNLIYTALTRAKRLAIFVGTKKAVAIATKNNKPVMRYTLLKERLKE